ncbi:MAG: protein serine/threonine phosphatase [Bacteroidetes bacterium]|jgi:serine phosphatase RsbU (regulator of sigma subunit)/tetratricopeptide (TPR) repeat protein|nr:protein serine/threonine phosphatase [Bacteroidota bacterium]
MKTSIRLPLYFTLLFLFAHLFSYSQQNKLGRVKDSLLGLLNKHESLFTSDSVSLADTVRLKLMNKLGTAYFKMSENQNTYLYCTKAKALAMKLLSKPAYADNRTVKRELAQSYLTLSVYYQVVGVYVESLENHFKCIKIREELGDQMGIAEALNIAGNLYKDQGNAVKGLEMYNKALTIREKILKEQPDNKLNKKGIAGLYNNIALVYKMQSKYDECIRMFFKSLEIKQSLGDELYAANTLGNLGTAYTEIKNFELGTLYHMKALKIHKEYGDRRGVANTYYNLAENLILQAREATGAKRAGFLKEAKQYLDETLPMAIEIADAAMLKDFYSAYTKIYELENKFDKSLEYYKMYIQLRDSLINSENLQKTVRAEMNNEFEKKELVAKQKKDAKEEDLRHEHDRQKTIRNLFIAGFGCMLILAVLIFISVRQKQKANHYMELQKQEVEIQKSIAEKKQKQIIDSINYAQRIQSSILPEMDDLKKLIPECFSYYLPKDIVSGDFYWFAQIPSTKEIMLVVADCTGHGVPGAFLSMVGSTLLNEIVVHKHITDPVQIVKELSYGLSLTLINKEDDQVDMDGMDVSICLVNPSKRTLSIAAVNQNIYLIDKNGLKKIEPQISSGDGIFDLNATVSLVPIIINLEPGTWVYMPTDGFAMQGNPDNQEFGHDRLGELLLRIHSKPDSEQQALLSQAFNEWKGSARQLDDILVMGYRIS